jgi:putative transposase
MWLHYRFSLSYRHIELMMAERRLTLAHETIRYLCLKFGMVYAKKLKNKKQWSYTWH